MYTRAPVLLEACVDTVAGAVAAVAAGADRIELCGPGDGGTTPSPTVIERCRDAVSVPLHVMVRPAGQDAFIYSDEELAHMVEAIDIARNAGCDGVVFGVLERSGRIAVSETSMLVKAAADLHKVFHRAFDQTPDKLAATEILKRLSIDSVLTSGGARTALEGAAVLRELTAAAGTALSVIAGGHVRGDNVRQIVEASGVCYVHARGTESSIIKAISKALNSI